MVGTRSRAKYLFLEAVFWRDASFWLGREVVFLHNGSRLIKTTSEAKMRAIIVKFEDWGKVLRNTVPVELQAKTP